MNNLETIHRTKLIVLDMLVTIPVIGLVMCLPSTDMTRASFFVIPFLYLIAAWLTNLYDRFFERGYLKSVIAVAAHSFVFMLLLSFVSFMLKDEALFSRRGLLYLVLLQALISYVFHWLERYYIRTAYKESKHSTKLVIVTDKSHLPAVLKKQQSFEEQGIDVVGITLLDDDGQVAQSGFSYLPSDSLVTFLESQVVDRVFIHLSTDPEDLRDLIYRIESSGIEVSLSVQIFNLELFENKRIQQFADFQIITFSSKFYSPVHIFLKRLLDILGALVGLILCALAGLVLVPLIRKDGGPAIFAQDRVGRNGRLFRFYKFRSMHLDAEAKKKELLAQNQMQGGMFKMENDPRITPIGRFIRKTSLDELPQFYNVLMGDMSLVGTRPPTVDEYEQYTLKHKKRLSFKPGITGLWQVSGRSDITDFEDVVKLDVAYIDNWTIWSDVVIILKTIKVILLKEGAR